MAFLRHLKRFFGLDSAEPAFSATGRGRLRSWVAAGSGPNTNIIYSLSELRRKSRDLTRNFSYMNGAYETVSSNIVGPGINVTPRTPDEYINQRLRELWERWMQECDISGTNDFASLLALAVRERWEAGEVFIRFVPDASGTIPLKLQLLSADQCKLEENRINTDGGQTIGGVTFDSIGRIKAYTFYQNNPTESVNTVDNFATAEIPAAEICHYYKQLWAGQVRGVPEAFSSLVKAREMLEYDEAELTKKKMAAMLAAFVTTPNPEGILNSDPDDPEAGLNEAVSKITTGTITTLAPGEDIKFNPPAEAGSSYEAFVQQNLRAIAESIQLTYEEFANDMSKANFSSIRAGLNITQRKHRQEQNRLVHQVVRKVYERFVQTAVVSGALPVDLTKYNQSPADYCRAKFQPAGWAYVNPVQEVTAQKEKVLSGFASRTQIIAEMGQDANEVDNQIALDASRAESLGLVFATDPTEGRGAPGYIPIAKPEEEEIV